MTAGKAMTIGRLAREAGVGMDTVRFYERSGLLPRPQRTASGYRLYEAASIERLRFVRRAKALGFSLADIGELLRLQAGRGSREQVKKLADRREADLERRIRELTGLRDALKALSRRCSGHGPLPGCPIIESLLDAHN